MPRSAASRPLSQAKLKTLERAAKAAADHSYSPYSEFRVGAAILTASGETFSGCNVENASYGLCNCAERTAIFTAAAAGHRQIRCVVVYTPTTKATAPCGACRQVIYEFGPTARVVSVCDSKDRLDTDINALLPGAFGPADLA
ncbi:cytidine deaminase [Actomonas aquatica]|uniref:Cytidine deaminase n=1 Tax=Actomonas aquatica TaxID=2866162 RepID=A0ABZ1CE92_9BACT|nr:cytidine deaminase [Opitutus sp. WL0086]WRQ88944.1 cytidine deaminase [Opitutus sp. WL0086]